MLIEKLVLDYLTAMLTTPVYMEVPEDPPETFAVVEKTGSSRMNMVDTAMIAVQSYGKSMQDAAELNETVKTAFDGMIMLPEIGSVKLSSDYNFTNTVTKRYRYQAVYTITYVA